MHCIMVGRPPRAPTRHQEPRWGTGPLALLDDSFLRRCDLFLSQDFACARPHAGGRRAVDFVMTGTGRRARSTRTSTIDGPAAACTPSSPMCAPSSWRDSCIGLEADASAGPGVSTRPPHGLEKEIAPGPCCRWPASRLQTR
jgi:hypothetical protein